MHSLCRCKAYGLTLVPKQAVRDMHPATLLAVKLPWLTTRSPRPLVCSPCLTHGQEQHSEGCTARSHARTGPSARAPPPRPRRPPLPLSPTPSRCAATPPSSRAHSPRHRPRQRRRSRRESSVRLSRLRDFISYPLSEDGMRRRRRGQGWRDWQRVHEVYAHLSSQSRRPQPLRSSSFPAAESTRRTSTGRT